MRNSRERSLLGTFSPSSACLSEKKEIRMQQNVDLAQAAAASSAFLLQSLRGNPAFTAFASEIILVRESNKKSLQEFRF